MPKPLLGTLAGRVSLIHELSGLDRSEMSALATLTQCHVGMIIRGDVKEPSAATLIKIAHTFGTSLEWLMTGEGEAPTRQSVLLAIRAATAASGFSSRHASHKPRRSRRAAA